MSNAAMNKLNTEEAGKRAGVNRGTIVYWIQAGLLKATNVGDGLQRPRWQINVEDLDEAIVRRNEFFFKKNGNKKSYKNLNSLKPYPGKPGEKLVEAKEKPANNLDKTIQKSAKSADEAYIAEILEENRSLRKKIDELKADLEGARNANSKLALKNKKLVNDMLEVLSMNE